MPQENQNDNLSVAKCWIYLNSWCKFDFVFFLEKIYKFGPWSNSGGRFFNQSA